MKPAESPHSLTLRLRNRVLSQRFAANTLSAGWQNVYFWFCIALLPSAVYGIWNTGFQIEVNLTSLVNPQLNDWQQQWLYDKGIGDSSPLLPIALGLLYFLPLLIASLLTCKFWDRLFAYYRHRPLQEGNLFVGLLFVLLLPVTMPVSLTIVGISFGIVFGKLIFGGNGRYLVNPSLVGILFLYYSYPQYFNGQESFLPITGTLVETSWRLLVESDITTSLNHQFNWMQFFIGNEVGAIGTTSILAALIGLIILMARQHLPWRIVVSALLGLIITTLLLNLSDKAGVWQIPWFWHLVVGNFIFVLVFVSTDPTVAPLSRGGCYLYGGLFGFLTVVIRVANPNHPEGSLQALLLASILVPLLDWIVIEAHRHIRMRQRSIIK